MPSIHCTTQVSQLRYNGGIVRDLLSNPVIFKRAGDVSLRAYLELKSRKLRKKRTRVTIAALLEQTAGVF